MELVGITRSVEAVKDSFLSKIKQLKDEESKKGGAPHISMRKIEEDFHYSVA